MFGVPIMFYRIVPLDARGDDTGARVDIPPGLNAWGARAWFARLGVAVRFDRRVAPAGNKGDIPE